MPRLTVGYRCESRGIGSIPIFSIPVLFRLIVLNLKTTFTYAFSIIFHQNNKRATGTNRQNLPSSRSLHFRLHLKQHNCCCGKLFVETGTVHMLCRQFLMRATQNQRDVYFIFPHLYG